MQLLSKLRFRCHKWGWYILRGHFWVLLGNPSLFWTLLGTLGTSWHFYAKWAILGDIGDLKTKTAQISQRCSTVQTAQNRQVVQWQKCPEMPTTALKIPKSTPKNSAHWYPKVPKSGVKIGQNCKIVPKLPIIVQNCPKLKNMASSIAMCMLYSLEHLSLQSIYIRFSNGQIVVIPTGKLTTLNVLVLFESESTSSFISIQWIFWRYFDKSGKNRFLLNGQVGADRGAGLNQLLRPGLGSKISL